jgi:hypothetical protein
MQYNSFVSDKETEILVDTENAREFEWFKLKVKTDQLVVLINQVKVGIRLGKLYFMDGK